MSKRAGISLIQHRIRRGGPSGFSGEAGHTSADERERMVEIDVDVGFHSGRRGQLSKIVFELLFVQYIDSVYNRPEAVQRSSVRTAAHFRMGWGV